jgi:hypothetical protein
MRFLFYSLLCISLFRCSSQYSQLAVASVDDDCALRMRPALQTGLYAASIDVVGNHISGLLFFKQMPDSSWRVVFTNEVGVTFLDMGLSAEDPAKVYSVVKQLDRKAVLKTIQKDFELVIGLPFRTSNYTRYLSGDEVYFGYNQKKDWAYFITSKDCASLQRLERGSLRKRIVSATISSPGYPVPDRIEITHHTFDMQITLSRIQGE